MATFGPFSPKAALLRALQNRWRIAGILRYSASKNGSGKGKAILCKNL